MAEKGPGRLVGEIASGVATGREEKNGVFSFWEAEAGPAEALEALLEIFNVSFFGASILSIRKRCGLVCGSSGEKNDDVFVLVGGSARPCWSGGRWTWRLFDQNVVGPVQTPAVVAIPKTTGDRRRPEESSPVTGTGEESPHVVVLKHRGTSA